MTREEAIKIIDCYDIGFYDLSGEKIPADKLADAFDMAIEALKGGDAEMRNDRTYTNAPYMQQTPSEDGSDLINRAELIKAIPQTSIDMFENCRNCELLDREQVIDVINEVPSVSAEAVQGWIPVEEQPPEFPCLVCDANGNQPSVPLGIVTITDEEHGEWHIDGRLWDSPKVFVDGEWGSQLGYGNRIIAWMPLPKPYRKESEVE